VLFSIQEDWNIQLLNNYSSQETEVTSTPTRPVENVLITTKGLQDRNKLLLDGRTVENKGKLILTIENLDGDTVTAEKCESLDGSK
jgi:hypothetical protein